ncbi:MAG: lipid A deacylase LpxR family protein [Alphaproteobacteria bacterium]|jgi:hypothetical protein|nr:lipid A deacylase LpxR family protein [Alphaproteobacteria bacterium]MDP6564447.1 lipid A deacylase LpxR family protein [Alphaproteobacteria bacterium]MDP6813416.1 lipid A deacylase LpxR family protein [Alphaproteobacteria bacterium]
MPCRRTTEPAPHRRQGRAKGPILSAALLLVGSAAMSATAVAEDTPAGTYTFQFENDLFYGADRHYTNGARLSWVSPPNDKGFDPLSGLLKLLRLNHEGSTRRGFALAQEIYTPADRRRTDLIDDDRPYAGWLYLATSRHTETAGSGGFKRKLDSVELDFGIVGPHAYGKETQDYVHDLRVIDRFDGWHHQLRDEPGVVLMYERKWRDDPRPAFPKSLEMDVVPHVGGSIGNVLSHVNVGGAVRYGHNVPEDFGPPSLMKGMRTLDSHQNDGGYSLYAFAGAEARLVAWNIFLDGNTFRDSHRVDKEALVADLSIGLAYEYGCFKIAYTSVLRSREFQGQADNSRFGSLSVSWRFP